MLACVMPEKIKILDPEIVNQIAAGEVVERPSHIVKELLENSMDAGATSVEIEFEQGGRYIKVKDNGFGINKEQLKLALSAHATSKIKTVHDIWNLNSFGFRGEALASIASVSDLTLTSRVKNKKESHRLFCDFGKFSEIETLSGEAGTTIVVKNLFENIPARLKFLKSEAAEHTQIKNVIKAVALAHPEVAFRVRSKGKLVYFWESVADKKMRCTQVLEEEQLFLATQQFENFNAEIYMSAPNNTVKTSKQMWFFVQNRWVQDRSMQAAVMDAYRNLLMHREFPIVAVWIEAPLDEVDANIHPTKSQVKFNNPSNAYRVVHRAVREQLEKAPWLNDLLGSNENLNQTENYAQGSPSTNSGHSDRHLKMKSGSEKPYNNSSETFIYNDNSKSLNFSDVAFQITQKPQKTFVHSEGSVLNEAPSIQETSVSTQGWSQLQVLGQADLTYIVAQKDDSLILVDQHAAHERVAFEKLMFAWKKGQIDVQRLLIPLTFKFEEEFVVALLSQNEDLEKLGTLKT